MNHSQLAVHWYVNVSIRIRVSSIFLLKRNETFQENNSNNSRMNSVQKFDIYHVIYNRKM